MAKTIKIREAVSVEDIYVTITCKCGKQFKTQLKGKITPKTCRCAKHSYYFGVEAIPGFLRVTVVHEDSSGREEYLIDDIDIERD